MELDGKEMWSGQDCAPGEETQKKGYKGGDLPGKWTVQAFWAPQNKGSDKGSSAHLADWRVSEINRGGLWEAQFLLMKSIPMFMCTWSREEGLHWNHKTGWLLWVFFFFLWPPWCMAQSEPNKYSSTVCLVLLLHAGGRRVGMTEEKAQLWDTVGTETLSLNSEEAAIPGDFIGGTSRGRPGLWWQLNLHTLCPELCWAPTLAPLVQSVLTSEAKGAVAMMATEQRRSPPSPGSNPSTSSSSPISYQSDCCQHSLGRNLTCFTSNSALQLKPLGTCQLYNTPTWGHILKTATVNYFT